MLSIWSDLRGELLEHSGSLSNNVAGTFYPEVAVVGVGNLLLGDDGVGVHLAHRLADKIDDSDVAVIDAGTVPELFLLVDGRFRKLIFVDAVRAGGPPGSIYRFGLEVLETQSELPFSLHDMTLLGNLRLLALLGKEPESVVIIGIEPKNTEFGTQLSLEVEKALPKAIELVLEEIGEFSKHSMEVR